MQPLENSLNQVLLPAITGRPVAGDMERNLLVLQARHGGLGISKPPDMAKQQHAASLNLTSNMVKDLTKKLDMPADCFPTYKSSAQIHEEARIKAKKAAEELHQQLPPKLQHTRQLASEKGASSWLTVIPMAEHGFVLPKGTFRDALCLRYGWPVPGLPTTCVCGSPMEIEHALSCKFGGLPIRRHNEVRNLLASCLQKVGCATTLEPPLQRLSGEVFTRQTTTRDDEARLDVKAVGFWGEGCEEAFFDIRVFNPFASSYCSRPSSTNYLRHEREKCDRYEERVLEVERGAFTPLVFAATGGASQRTTVFLKRLATLLSEKEDQPYSLSMAWLRARLAFSLLRSAVACLRSTRKRFTADWQELQPSLAANMVNLT